jgi:hypothetical protein
VLHWERSASSHHLFPNRERGDINVKGINTKMLIKYIQDILAQACGALDRYPLCIWYWTALPYIMRRTFWRLFMIMGVKI